MPKPFKFSSENLIWYRKEANLTQRQVGMMLKGFPKDADNEFRPSATNAYQRIEQRGKTVPATAEKIAEILKIPVDSLRPGKGRAKAFGELLDSITQALTSIKEDANKEHLLREKVQNERFFHWDWLPSTLFENDIENVAIQVAESIERLSLARAVDERETVSELLDMPKEAHSQTAYAQGLWLIYCPLIDGTSVGNIVAGLINVPDQIEQYVDPECRHLLRASISDPVDENFIRIQLKYTDPALDKWIEISRCAPSSGGQLSYASPPPRDWKFLRLLLSSSLKKYAWVVEGPNMPAPEPASLAFRLLSKTNPIDAPMPELIRGAHSLSRLMEIWGDVDGVRVDPYVVQVKRSLRPALIEKLSGLITGKGRWALLKGDHPILVHEHGEGLGFTYHHIELVMASESDEAPCVVHLPKREMDSLVTEIEQLIETNEGGNNL